MPHKPPRQDNHLTERNENRRGQPGPQAKKPNESKLPVGRAPPQQAAIQELQAVEGDWYDQAQDPAFANYAAETEYADLMEEEYQGN